MLPLSMRASYILCISYLIFTASAQDQPGQLTQFLDYDCTEKSPVNPTVFLPLDTCLVTTGAIGVVPQRLPVCSTGNATLQVYGDQECAIPDPASDGDDDNNCFTHGVVDIPAVMFICGSIADGNVDPTSTTTVIASSVLQPVAEATGATTTSTPGGISSQTSVDSNSLDTSTAPTSSTSNPLQSNAGSGGESSSSGLSQHDQIVLGIVLPVGSLLVALLAWLCPKPWYGARGQGQQDQYRMLDYSSVHHMPHWHRG